MEEIKKLKIGVQEPSFEPKTWCFSINVNDWPTLCDFKLKENFNNLDLAKTLREIADKIEIGPDATKV